jgi:hypothetical protein
MEIFKNVSNVNSHANFANSSLVIFKNKILVHAQVGFGKFGANLANLAVLRELSLLKKLKFKIHFFFKVEIEENELNLRRNIILGGVYYFDMLQIPPQPKRVGNWVICQLETPQVCRQDTFTVFLCM